MEKTENDLKPIDEKTLHKFSSPWHFSDVVLVVEGTKFHVHRSTLSMWSSVFENMFTSTEFAERNAKEILLPEKRAEEVEELLKVIYSDYAKQEVTETNFEFLLELAREYQMDKVQKYCTQYMGQDINDKNCLHRYKIAERFELKDLMEKCEEEARFQSSTDLEESDDFLELGSESKFKLCMARIKELEKALTEYADICSKLVNGYYEMLSVNMPRDPLMKQCDNIKSHSYDIFPCGRDFESYGEATKEVDSSCKYCRERIDQYKSSIKVKKTAMFFDSYFVKLNNLEHGDDDNVAKIRKQINASKSRSCRESVNPHSHYF